MSSPVQRTKAILKAEGIQHSVVERYFPKSKKYPYGCKEDLFNIIDILALDGGFLGIQVCGADLQPHIEKITQEHSENTLNWLNNGGRLEIWAWAKRKYKRGLKRMIWKCRIVDILVINGRLVAEYRE